MYISVVDTWTMKNTVYSDQTGQFPTRSRSGNRYIMVMVEIDSNYTLVEPMKNRTDEVMTAAYLALMKRLQRAGVTTTKHVLDNECSYKLKERCHCRNIAEVAIKGFKQHFLGVDDFETNKAIQRVSRQCYFQSVTRYWWISCIWYLQQGAWCHQMGCRLSVIHYTMSSICEKTSATLRWKKSSTCCQTADFWTADYD